jgi:hypothetical protein
LPMNAIRSGGVMGQLVVMDQRPVSTSTDQREETWAKDARGVNANGRFDA